MRKRSLFFPCSSKANALSPSSEFTCLTHSETEEMAPSHTVPVLSRFLVLTSPRNFGRSSRDDVKTSSLEEETKAKAVIIFFYHVN